MLTEIIRLRDRHTNRTRISIYRFHRPQPRRSIDPHKSGIFRTVAVLRVQTGHGPFADLLRWHVHHTTATGTYLRRTFFSINLKNVIIVRVKSVVFVYFM